MVKFLLPLLMGLAGTGAGTAAAYFLRPPPAEGAAIDPCGADAETGAETDAGAAPDGSTPDEEDAGRDFVRLNNQFVVPVVEGGDVAALVILSLTLEVAAGGSEAVFASEPRLRDEFLQVLFDHANAGGFDGTFTEAGNLDALRGALLEVAASVLGGQVSDVLIVDIVRQDA